jgi:hypothetical protein
MFGDISVGFAGPTSTSGCRIGLDCIVLALWCSSKVWGQRIDGSRQYICLRFLERMTNCT